MQKQQAEAARKANNTQNTTSPTAHKEAPVEAEYIEFEEVKKK